MYHVSYFKAPEQHAVVQFMHRHPFALLTGSFRNGQQVATQIPMMLEERDGHLFLQGHLMRNTDHHKAFLENPQALVVFTGPSCYVSANWYSNPQSGSTWNYSSVHVAGELRFMEADELVAFMRKLTLYFEGGNQQSATVYDNLPDSYVDKMMPAIVGFEIGADKLDNVFKLSQNKDEQSFDNIVHQLTNRGGESALVAAQMQEIRAALFG